MSGGVTRIHKGVAYTSEVTLDRNTCAGCDLVGENCGAFIDFEGCGPAYQDYATDEKPCIIWIEKATLPVPEVKRKAVNPNTIAAESRSIWRAAYVGHYYGNSNNSHNRPLAVSHADAAMQAYLDRFL